MRNSLGQVRALVAGWDPIIFRGAFGQLFRLDAMQDLSRILQRIVVQDAQLSDVPVAGVSERLGMFDAITHFASVLPSIKNTAVQLQSDILQVDTLLRLSSYQSLESIASAGVELTALSRARRRIGRTRALRRAAMRELNQLGGDKQLTRMVRLWLGILAMRRNLAPELSDAQSAVMLIELVAWLEDRRGGAAPGGGLVAVTKLRDRINELAGRDQAARDRLRREFSAQELAGLGVVFL